MYWFEKYLLIDASLLFIIPDKKYWEKVRVITAILDGLTINVDVQMNRYANTSPVRSWTEPIPIGEYIHIKSFIKKNI
jgi:hypothetical protein